MGQQGPLAQRCGPLPWLLPLHLSPLRLLLVLLCTFALADPKMNVQDDALDLWILLDRSDSTEDLVDKGLPEWQRLLDQAKPGRNDKAHYFDYGAEIVEHGSDGTSFTGSRKLTRSGLALSHITALAKEDRPARVLLFTDGFSTEPVDGLAETLVERGVPLDLRFPPLSLDEDYAIAAIDMPRRVLPREGLIVSVVIRGPIDATVPVEVSRDGEPIAGLTAEVIEGQARVRFADRLAQPGSHRYCVRILPERDAHPGNDVAERWIEVVGGPRVLVVSGYEPSPLATRLRAQRIEVEEVTDLAKVHVGMLAGAKGVILDNVPAHRLDPAFIRGLEFFVTEQGGGLAMIGGRFSFAGGGWSGSAIAELLPVTMELKEEHRKLAVAMAIVLDRSGSMAMTAPGTGRTKMSLADDGAARSIELLGESDFVAVIPVDSAPHPLSDGLVAVGPNRQQLISATRRVTSGGGGIYCYTGLKAAWSMLEGAEVGQRHVILFADAADAEEPGEYKALLAEMTAAKCTVSVIGLGSETDSDAELLRDIARLGNGRVFFNANAAELPALFQMETATIARSAFLEDPVGVNGTPGWLEIAATPLDWPATIPAYNLVYLKAQAAQAAVSTDDYAAPLVAFWQRGAGRAASVAFPLGGEHSDSTRAWEGCTALVGTLGRWLIGPSSPEGIGLRTTVDGSRVRFELHHDESWADRLAIAAPRLAVARGSGGTSAAIPWERIAPGTYSASFELTDTDFLRGAVTVGDAVLSAGPLDVTVDPEWTFDPRARDQVRATALASGGVERLDLSDVWTAPRPVAWQGLGRWLTPLLLLGLLLEALETQTGWKPKRRSA